MSITIEESAKTGAKSLSGYLNDALTSETLAVDLVERAITENESTRLRGFLTLLSWELEEDRESLVRLMGELGVRRKHVGVARARFAEKLARLRPTPSSPSLSAELESLHLRINGKLDMWDALRAGVGARVDGIDVDELIRRTKRQAEELERRRLAVAGMPPSDPQRALRMRRTSISGGPSTVGGVATAGN
jgi:hypothetical protein